MAGTHESLRPQIEGLSGTFTPNNDETDSVGSSSPEEQHGCSYLSSCRGILVCAFDNRGVGRSSVPTKKSDYTSKIMAKDAIALFNHLGWRKAHVFGHSMGAMIACKLAAMVPDRVLSLALVNVKRAGRGERKGMLSKFDRQTLSIAYRFLKAKLPEERAAVDLETHYTKQYVKGISATWMQSNFGFEGQVNACWTNKITQTEVELIKSGGFSIAVIHGRHDIIAQIYYARRLAERLQPMARMVDLHGGHLVSHERTEEVNQALLDLIKASELKMNARLVEQFAKEKLSGREKGVSF